jgi:hypothetical protein
MGLGIVDDIRAFLHFEPPQTEAPQVVDGAFPFYANLLKRFCINITQRNKMGIIFLVSTI